MSKSSKKNKEITNRQFISKAAAEVQKIAGGAKVQFGQALPQKEKISNALQTLLKMETSEDWPLAELQSALVMVVSAWNISQEAVEKHEEMIQNVVDNGMAGADVDAQAAVLRMLKKVIITKNILYPDDKRFVVSYEVKRQHSRLFVSAAALRPPTENLTPAPNAMQSNENPAPA